MPGAIRLDDDEESQHGRVADFLDDSREMLGDAAEEGGKRITKFWHGFTSFAVQDNVLEVAVGLMQVFLHLPLFVPKSST